MSDELSGPQPLTKAEQGSEAGRAKEALPEGLDPHTLAAYLSIFVALGVSLAGPLLAFGLQLLLGLTPALRSSVLIVLKALAILVVLALVAARLRRFRRLVAQGKLTPLNLERQSATANVLTNVLHRLKEHRGGNGDLPLRLWRTEGSSPPLALLSRGEFNLILPASFESLAAQEEEMAQAILAHELGHFAQDDTRFRVVAEAFLGTVLTVLVPLELVSLLVGGIAFWYSAPPGESFLGWFGAAAVPLVMLLYAEIRVRASRHEAEHLADGFALLLVGEPAIRAAIERFASERVSYPSTHPTRSERLSVLSQFKDWGTMEGLLL